MPLRFTLRQLEYFVAVSEAGSIALASDRINVSSPSISHAVSLLEAELGVQLFIRKHARGLSLTSSGRAFLKQTKRILEEAESLNTLAADIAVEISGQLGVGCLRTIAPMVLSEVRRSFENTYPSVTIKQFEGDHAELVRALQRAQIDVALTYDLDLPADVRFEPLYALPPYVMLPPTHRLAGQTAITPEELIEEPLILLDLPSSSQYFLSAFSASGLKPKIAERVQDLALVRSMVANGFGYSLANLRLRSNLAPDGKLLKYVTLAGGLRPLHFGFAVNQTEHKPRTLAAFEDHCQAIVDAQGLPGLSFE